MQEISIFFNFISTEHELLLKAEGRIECEVLPALINLLDPEDKDRKYTTVFVYKTFLFIETEAERNLKKSKIDRHCSMRYNRLYQL